jgi:hypothetical protein
MNHVRRKESGAYYTPDDAVTTLVSWVVRDSTDRMLDPSCGDGRFISRHGNSVGVEEDPAAAGIATARAPDSLVHVGEFFAWASSTVERFDCAVGNPPFIRYQTFKGGTRERALALCDQLGASFSGLTSSWAPFLVATASLLRPGGRMAFVVPAEVGHAPYAAPLLEYLVAHFAAVHVIGVRNKLFPELSEDCWLLYAEGFGGHTTEIGLSIFETFTPCAWPPRPGLRIPATEWRAVWKRRLRPFLLPETARNLYRDVVLQRSTLRLGQVATVGIGYVSGANEFFHLRPSQAKKRGIPHAFTHPTVRNGRMLPRHCLTAATVENWHRADEPVLLLRISRDTWPLPGAVRMYLETDEGRAASQGYKCRMRDPWYVVPDVQVPDLFLTYMSGREVCLVRNDAGCTCTNSVHSVRLKDRSVMPKLLRSWDTPFVRLSCEIEGHPLGGGLLKLEPREATAIAMPDTAVEPMISTRVIEEGIAVMRAWRHCGDRAQQG